MEKDQVYELITNRICDLLGKGIVPWKKPWNGGEGIPQNLISRKPYRGINVFLLSSLCFESPYFLTFKQAKEFGGFVKSGEKACPVIFWKWLEKQDPEGEVFDAEGNRISRIPLLRYYSVFNVAQTEGIPSDKIPPTGTTENPFNPVQAAQSIVDGLPNKPLIVNSEARAYYRPSTDLVNVPRPNLFQVGEEYYSTLFHELTHSTGHESRLNRKGIVELNSFGSHEYSKEELVAEMGAAYLCAQSGIVESTIQNSAAYISGWLKRLRNDNKFVVQAAAQAQKAADFILNRKHNQDESEA
jgi:antirestriction protein ArdC